MITDLTQKNNYMLALRDHLQAEYQTTHHYTCGEDNQEALVKNGAYILTRKDPSQPKDISGFYFRKDLCDMPPQNRRDIVEKVHNFSKGIKNLESELTITPNGTTMLTLKLDNKEYILSPHIEEGCSGEIGIHLMKALTWSPFGKDYNTN